MPNPKRKISDILTEGKDVIEDAASDKPPKKPEPDDVLLPTSLRLPKSIVTRLNRAAFEQKEAEQHPQTRQDIIIDALKHWLDRYEQRKR